MGNLDNFTYDKNGELLIDNVSSLALAKQFGTPLFVVNETLLRKKCEMFRDLLKELYPNSLISYPSPAFSCKYIYKIIGEYNFSCLAFSTAEIQTAINSKFPASKIYFFGNKTKSDLEFALKNKIYNFILDNISEFELLQKLVSNNQSLYGKINIFVQINLTSNQENTTSKDNSNKFGINLDGNEAEKFINIICQNKFFNFQGLHYHLGHQIFDKNIYINASKQIMNLVYTLKQKYNIDIKTIDIGGGFGAKCSPKDPQPKQDDYKKILSGIVKEVKNSVNKYNLIEPTIIIEPGTSLVAEAGSTLFSVVNTKEVKNGKKYVAVDGNLPNFTNSQQCIVAKCNHIEEKQEKITLLGKFFGNEISKDTKVEKLNPLDTILVASTGAYNYSLYPNFNKNSFPPVVVVKDKKAKLIVKTQSFNDFAKFDL